LPECISSILNQSYREFEVLILDDCSPDDTPAIASSFQDPRIRYVRNQENLGHIRNYNQGIELSRGKYIWLISADDRLRNNSGLARFVEILDANQTLGFVFSPAVGLEDDCETETVRWSQHGVNDQIFRGHDFLDHLLNKNGVCAAGAMARKSCYEKSLFPLELPYTGDWYLWCLFALHTDVAYVAEPIVNYRSHAGSITTQFSGPKLDERIANEIAVRWRIKRDAQNCGYVWVGEKCEDALVADYIRRVAWKIDGDWMYGLTLDGFEQSLTHYSENAAEAARISARVYTGLGDHYYWRRDDKRADIFYRFAMQRATAMPIDPSLRYLLMHMGRFGYYLRSSISLVRRAVKG
jgi:glycosyltransferase involved in cell wall biosynthesis